MIRKSVLKGIGALLIASTFANPANCQENWVLVGGGGAVTVYMDISSFKQLPNGVTSYKERIKGPNPITGQSMNIDRPRGIDCKTKEIVYIPGGAREKMGIEEIKSILKTCPGEKCNSYVIAFSNFCPSGSL